MSIVFGMFTEFDAKPPRIFIFRKQGNLSLKLRFLRYASRAGYKVLFFLKIMRMISSWLTNGDFAMKKMCAVHGILWFLVIVGALNWGLVGFFGFDLVAKIFGSMTVISRIIYALIGLSGLLLLFSCAKKCGKCGECSK